MKTKIPMEQLLRWRLAQAEADAPPAPGAAHLLELARPWWETWPEQFQAFAERLGKIQIAYGHAMAEPRQPRSSHPVPTLFVRAIEEMETSARVLYFSVRDGCLRLRFQLDAASGQAPKSLDVTLVCDKTGEPLLSAKATASVDHEYSVDVELPEELAGSWEQLKVTDRMPFRFILRAEANDN